MDIAGARVTSQCHVKVQAANELTFDTAFYEASITSLFIPYLIQDIPEIKWLKLQDKLKSLIKSIIREGVKK